MRRLIQIIRLCVREASSGNRSRLRMCLQVCACVCGFVISAIFVYTAYVTAWFDAEGCSFNPKTTQVLNPKGIACGRILSINHNTPEERLNVHCRVHQCKMIRPAVCRKQSVTEDRTLQCFNAGTNLSRCKSHQQQCKKLRGSIMARWQIVALFVAGGYWNIWIIMPVAQAVL